MYFSNNFFVSSLFVLTIYFHKYRRNRWKTFICCVYISTAYRKHEQALISSRKSGIVLLLEGNWIIEFSGWTLIQLSFKLDWRGFWRFGHKLKSFLSSWSSHILTNFHLHKKLMKFGSLTSVVEFIYDCSMEQRLQGNLNRTPVSAKIWSHYFLFNN